MAKRFKFRLETLRKLRKRRQDECRRMVAARLRQIAGVQDQIDAFNDQLDLHVAAMRRLAWPGSGSAAGAAAGAGRVRPVWTVDLTGVRRHRVYTNHLRHTLTAAWQQVVALRAELTREQGVLAKATKAVKVLDKLEERQRQRHDLALARAERAETDEIAAQCARRNASAKRAAAATDDRL